MLNVVDVIGRLDELRSIQDGWLDGNGKAPDHAGLDWLALKFELSPERLLPPFIYPTSEGGIQAEWSLENYEVSLEIDLSVYTGEWSCLNVSTGESSTELLDLNSSDAWTWLTQELERLGQAPK